MRALSYLSLSVALAALPTAALAAQDTPDLSGRWVMQIDKSKFGSVPGPKARTDVIQHNGPSLTIARTQTTETGEMTSTMVYAVDGKPHKNKVGDNDVTSVLSWDGASLVIESTVATPEGEIKVTDRYSLLKDRKTLIQERVLSVPGQVSAQTIVLAKQ